MDLPHLKEIRSQLNDASQKELVEIILRLSKHKKENKELLTYLLDYKDSDEAYIAMVQKEIKTTFDGLNKNNHYILVKGIRKVLRITKKYIRYAQSKKIEVESLLYFCSCLQTLPIRQLKTKTIEGIMDKQLEQIEKSLSKLHEDIQFDYRGILDELKKPTY